MKQRIDFVSNSSSSSYVVPIDTKNHEKSKWMKNTLVIQPDNNKIMMKFDDFNVNGTWQNSVIDNWKFVCTQLLHWICPSLCFDSTRESIKKIVRSINNDPEFNKLNNAVIEYFKDQGIEMNGVEFDEEDLRIHKEEDGDYYVTLVPDCSLDHESVYENFDDLLKHSGCDSIAELIWGVKEIRISWN